MAWHRAQLLPRWHLSFYLPLNALADGGELEVFHRPRQGVNLNGLSAAAARGRLATHGVTCVRPGPGDLVIFDGGRYNHRVCPSTEERWTLGGFAGSGKHFDATVTARNRDGIVVFAYNSQKGNFQSAAQNVAKNLKKHIEESLGK